MQTGVTRKHAKMIKAKQSLRAPCDWPSLLRLPRRKSAPSVMAVRERVTENYHYRISFSKGLGTVPFPLDRITYSQYTRGFLAVFVTNGRSI